MLENVTKGESSVRVINGVVEYDSKTTFPYTILETVGSGSKEKALQNVTKKTPNRSIGCNLIVCHDIFDTQERFRIFVSPLLKRNNPLIKCQVLLWNYPGQAFTNFATSEVLNNEFHAKCFERLLSHVGEDGTNEFDTSKPFYIMGHGHGGGIASLYAAGPKVLRSMKGLLLVNPITFIDTHFASIMHDCRNVFGCSPETRPDLPLYFYARFLFSEEYLEKHSTPLVLNLYSAVHNPITLQGRVQLCDGVLKSIDLRMLVKDIPGSVISIHGSKSGLVRPLHASTFLAEGRVSCTSIQQAIEERRGLKNSVVIMSEGGGHELFLEKKGAIFRLLEQTLLLESNNKMDGRSRNGHLPRRRDLANLAYSITSGDNSKVSKDVHNQIPNTKGSEHNPCENPRTNLASQSTKELGGQNPKLQTKTNPSKKTQLNCKNSKTLNAEKSPMNQLISPEADNKKQNIEEPDRTVYHGKKEYMSWRLRRNKKRLSRFQKAAQVIQNGLRVYMAKTMIARLKRQTSALMIQRCYRGMRGRILYLEQRKLVWAARFVQRAYRGSTGRQTSYARRMEIRAQVILARWWRGNTARRMVMKILIQRREGAITLQCLWRRWTAYGIAFELRRKIDAAITLQRCQRGYWGRCKATTERERYLFSKSQSSGIVEGRELLAEHKLHATRLESELSILLTEKNSLESEIGKVIKEVTAFEETVLHLEKAMHELHNIEAARNISIHPNDTQKHEIRQKKMELDQEFSVVLMKISDRKSQLQTLEQKLAHVGSNQQSKRDELKQLERKLVVLLEAQERSLDEIRRRQDRRFEGVAREKISNDGEDTVRKEFAKSSDQEAKKLLDSTETMMKFGFMSMTMTYFSSMNMVRAMKTAPNAFPGNNSNTNVDQKSSNKLLSEHHDGTQKVKSHLSTDESGMDVSCWDVESVIQWLSSISLSQYTEAFREGSVDGPFLFQLTEDDLRNVLGVEHRLHRKKLLFGIQQLAGNSPVFQRVTENTTSNDKAFIEETKTPDTSLEYNTPLQTSPKAVTRIGSDLMPSQLQANLESEKKTKTMPILSLDDLCRWIRNEKYDSLKEALAYLPNKLFEENCISVQFVEDAGTIYVDSVDRELFHINKTDEHGNTLMHIAAQNGNLKIAKILKEKGANPNHQNIQGQTPGHFAVSYQFYEFARWLFDEGGGGANDLLTNMYGLGPYDGLTEE